MQREVSLGVPRFYSCVRLPEAYRRLPRPSSASQAKPSPRRRSVSSLLIVWILGVCLTFRGCYPLYVGVKWCLHGVHCEPEKSSLHPSPRRRSRLGLHQIGWSLLWRHSYRRKLLEGRFKRYKRCAHLSHFEALYCSENNVEL